MLKIETPFARRREKAEQRLIICRQCEKYNDLLVQCMECGCFLKAKTLWPYTDCPLGKWGSYKEEKHG
jgi:hypothetical protein